MGPSTPSAKLRGVVQIVEGSASMQFAVRASEAAQPRVMGGVRSGTWLRSQHDATQICVNHALGGVDVPSRPLHLSLHALGLCWHCPAGLVERRSGSG